MALPPLRNCSKKAAGPAHERIYGFHQESRALVLHSGGCACINRRMGLFASHSSASACSVQNSSKSRNNSKLKNLGVRSRGSVECHAAEAQSFRLLSRRAPRGPQTAELLGLQERF